jgi:hypothetical protein
VNRARWVAALGLAAATAATVAAPPASAFNLGFNDNELTTKSGWMGGKVDETGLQSGLLNARNAGARTWRFMLVWRSVDAQGVAPSAADAANPAWSGYRWRDVDLLVRNITAAGLEPLPWVARAPDWAEGAGRPTANKFSPVGTWKPSAAALGNFAQALATRYSGSYPDPANPGQLLPQIKSFQAWNEPNLYAEITPQWSGGKPASPAIYRSLLNAFYAGVKKVQPSATVLGAGTAPFGGLSSKDPRVPPARFDRDLLCATKKGTTVTVKKKGCPTIKLDGWAHHTYPIGPPTRTARNKDDVVVPDMGKLTKIYNAAAKAGVVSKKAAKNVWITEMSWDSFPDPSGLSLADHAIYMEGAFYQLWKAGVQNILWWNSRDDAKGSDWNATLQSGIFMLGTNPADPTTDVRKPAWTAYHFPFTAYRTRGTATLWTKAPTTGTVTVEAQSASGAWSKAATLKSAGGGVLTGKLRVGPGTNLRAVQGSEVSLTWKTF